MTWVLARPSFWPEPRDPWAWQRALQGIAAASPVPAPHPCWRQVLGGAMSRRSVAGLYGLRAKPAPPTVVGVGLLQQSEAGWNLSPAGQALATLEREAFQVALAKTLVRQSGWLRLALIGLATGQWWLPRGAVALRARRQMRLHGDLDIVDGSLEKLPNARRLLGDLFREDVTAVVTSVRPEALSALHAPLYLLHALGWLDDGGRPRLPDELAASLAIESPAATLRRITHEEEDAGGFVPVDKVSERLRAAVCSEPGPSRATGNGDQLATWTDRTIGGAIETGAIEVHAWAPGQPRHGRGLYGDRDRKLVRWTVHDDLRIPATSADRSREVDR